VAWRAGDVVLFDNLSTQHSVTPTDAYTRAGQPLC
jgi:alpha-ketoglutarate-dependent taurine dioxygenase